MTNQLSGSNDRGNEPWLNKAALITAVAGMALTVLGVYLWIFGVFNSTIAGLLLFALGALAPLAVIAYAIVTRQDSSGGLFIGMGRAFLLYPAFNAGATVVAVAVGRFAIPIVADRMTALTENSYGPLYETESPFSQILILSLAVFIICAAIPLAFILIIGLPLLAIFQPGVASEGTHIEAAERKRSTRAVRLSFIGMSPLLLGIAFWVPTDASLADFPAALSGVMSSFRHGHLYWPDLQLVLGVGLTFIGGAVMAAGLLYTLVIRSELSKK